MAPTEPLSYDEIHGVQKRERSTRSLTKVSHDFYERLAAYLADAKAGLSEESAKGPSPRLVLLQGQFRNLEEMAREIMLLRLRKVTELAFSAVEGGALSDKLLTPEELTFAKHFQVLVEGTRATAFREGAARAPPAPPAAAPAPAPVPASPGPPRHIAAAPPAAPPPAPRAEHPAPSVVLLRILDDVPPFEGENNHVYRLKREDVITLPRDLAQILLRRKKAVILEVPP
jgi:DNA replication initiation complex subunit (GINS family)